jgi:hypothetical protein
MNKYFKQESKKYEIIALADINNGVPIERFKKEIIIQEIKENYIACEGLKNAINKIKNR